MKKYNQRYRVVSEFDYDDKIPYDHEKKRSCDDLGFIYCYNGRIRIHRQGKNKIRVTIFGSKVYQNIIKKFKEQDIDLMAEYDLDGEGWFIIDEKDIHEACKICKAKRQRNQPISVVNKKDNLKLWKKSQRWVGV